PPGKRGRRGRNGDPAVTTGSVGPPVRGADTGQPHKCCLNGPNHSLEDKCKWHHKCMQCEIVPGSH
ncbi:hypothetical protein ABG768_025699, partial [Culter alburnus]